MSTGTSPVLLGARLDAEWRHVATSSAAAGALAAWRRTEPVLVGYHDFEALREAVHDREDLQRSDAILAALVRLAAVTGHNDTTAAWLVIQLLKPGAIHLAGRLAPLVGGPAASEQLVFAELTHWAKISDSLDSRALNATPLRVQENRSLAMHYAPRTRVRTSLTKWIVVALTAVPRRALVRCRVVETSASNGKIRHHKRCDPVLYSCSLLG